MSAWEKRYALALTQPDPLAALRALAGDRRVPAALRQRFAAAAEDGVRLSALLVARLRFERLLRASPPAERWFDEDPASFAEAFKRYHAAVPPTAFFPRDEAALFERWCRKNPRLS
jgi:hypothetical protein